MVKVIDEKTNIYRFTLQRKQYYDLYIEADNKKEAKDEMYLLLDRLSGTHDNPPVIYMKIPDQNITSSDWYEMEE